jgi:AraC-like DNA-binding protein
MDARISGKASMSRARFAVHFRETVGTTPVNYLTQWRMGVAQTLLKKEKSIGVVAKFSRVFKAKIGQSPSTWLKLY